MLYVFSRFNVLFFISCKGILSVVGMPVMGGQHQSMYHPGMGASHGMRSHMGMGSPPPGMAPQLGMGLPPGMGSPPGLGGYPHLDPMFRPQGHMPMPPPVSSSGFVPPSMIMDGSPTGGTPVPGHPGYYSRHMGMPNLSPHHPGMGMSLYKWL